MDLKTEQLGQEVLGEKRPNSVSVLCLLEIVMLLLNIACLWAYFSVPKETMRQQTAASLKLQYELLNFDLEEITEAEIDHEISINRDTQLITIISFPISLLVIVGFIFGNRFLWYLYRSVGLVFIIIGTLFLAYVPIFFYEAMICQALWMYLNVFSIVYVVAIGWGSYFLLGTKSAREYFGAICPTCQFKKIRLHNLFATKVSCKSCGTEWT